MKAVMIVAAIAIAASPALARDKKEKKETPPPAPVVEYELGDAQFGEPLAEACLANPPEQTTYDSRDNVLIAKVDGGRAFFHFKSGCDTNSMMFAESIKAEDGSMCVRPGGALIFTSSYGDVKRCEIAKINRWLDEDLISPEDAAQ